MDDNPLLVPDVIRFLADGPSPTFRSLTLVCDILWLTLELLLESLAWIVDERQRAIVQRIQSPWTRCQSRPVALLRIANGTAWVASNR